MHLARASCLRILKRTRSLSSSSENANRANNEIGVQKMKKLLSLKKNTEPLRQCDILVIGGGAMGSSVAYWLKKKSREGLSVVVVEKDSTYKESSTVLSVGGLRQQFSLPENIEMSLFGAEFMRNARSYLSRTDLRLTPYGYLLLASESGSETLRRNSKLQNELGARNELLTAERLSRLFPWINTDGITLGCHGLEKEGWFDPWILLTGLQNQAKQYGAHFFDGEVVEFKFKESCVVQSDDAATFPSYTSPNKAVIRKEDGNINELGFAVCVIAAGSNSGKVGRLANIGTGQGILGIGLPIEPRKRYVYVLNSRESSAPSLGTPLTIDPDGTYFRCDTMSGNYICGRSPPPDSEPSVDSLDVDLAYFDTNVWPSLANRVKGFESIKVCSSWAGFYDYNTYDENGIVGQHPYYTNVFVTAGFSGHGIQQAPAVGRALSELILDGRYRTIDLSRLCFERLITQMPMFEENIV